MLPIVQGSLSQNSSKLPTKSNCKGGRELRSTLYLSGPKWHDSPVPTAVTSLLICAANAQQGAGRHFHIWVFVTNLLSSCLVRKERS